MAVIHDAELFTVGPDEIVVTFRTDEDATVTTAVGDHEVTTTGRTTRPASPGSSPRPTYVLAVDGVAPASSFPVGSRRSRDPRAAARDVCDGQRRALR